MSDGFPFWKQNLLGPSNGNAVSWTNNPIYQSPEASGISWYDQVEHWNPASEGYEGFKPSNTNDTFSHWFDNNKNYSGLNETWNRTSETVAQNAKAPAPKIYGTATPANASIAPPVATPSTSGIVNPAAGIQAATASAAEAGTVANKVADVTTGVAQTAEGIASATPVGMIALINSMLGDATAAGINASNQNQISKNYISNSMAKGSQSGFQAGLIKESEMAHANITNAGAKIGGIAGPLGAWFGSLIANAIQDSTPKDAYNDFKTGYSFDGKVNPQDTGLVASGTTSGLSGESNMTTI